MKRCPECHRTFSDSTNLCPDCSVLLRKVDEAPEDAAPTDEQARLAEIKRARMAALKGNSKGTAALSNVGVICAILDLILSALFVATSNIGGGLLAILALITCAIGTLLLKKPDLMTKSGASHANRETADQAENAPLPSAKKLRTLATVLVIIGIVCTVAQIGLQVSAILEQLRSSADMSM